jgi:hypothetical protein
MQRNRIVESMSHLDKEAEQALAVSKVRRTYEPPRRPNKDYLHAKLAFLDSPPDDQFDWKREVTPEWTVEWKVDEQRGGLVHAEEDYRDREVLKQVLEENSKIALTSESSSRIHFPVDVLAPECTLERLVKGLSYAPSLFAGNCRMSKHQKFKKTVVFGLLTSLQSLKTDKAFYPVLGETYQSEIPSSCSGYA